MRTSGVVAHHAADCCAICGRSIGTEQISHRPEMKIELFLNHARFDDGPSFLGVHFKHAVEIFRHVDDDVHRRQFVPRDWCLRRAAGREP